LKIRGHQVKEQSLANMDERKIDREKGINN